MYVYFWYGFHYFKTISFYNYRLTVLYRNTYIFKLSKKVISIKSIFNLDDKLFIVNFNYFSYNLMYLSLK
jgi:hypothetical protein